MKYTHICTGIFLWAFTLGKERVARVIGFVCVWTLESGLWSLHVNFV